MRISVLLALLILVAACAPAPVRVAVEIPEGMVCSTYTPTATATATNTPTPTATATETPVPTPTLDRNVLPPGARMVIMSGDGTVYADQWVEIMPDGWLPEGAVIVRLEAADGVVLAEGSIPVEQRR